MYTPRILVDPEFDGATPLDVKLEAETLLEEGSKLQVLLGLSKLGRTTCWELQTEALSDIILAEDQPQRHAIFMWCMDELAFSPYEVTTPNNKPSPLFAACVSTSLDAAAKVCSSTNGLTRACIPRTARALLAPTASHAPASLARLELF